MKVMMKRSRKLDITIDSLPSVVDNAGIMSLSSSTRSAWDGPSVKGITGLIGNKLGNFGVIRRRKNFSLILLAGLSAILCALYYTSFYPNTVWALRLGVTSFNTTQNGQQRRDYTRDFTSTLTHSHNHLENTRDSEADASDLQVKNIQVFPYASSTDTNSKASYMFSISSSVGDNHNNNAQKNEVHQTSEEISTPKTWNWKYWASLEYWKVNFTTDSVEDNGDILFSLEEKSADSWRGVKAIGSSATDSYPNPILTETNQPPLLPVSSSSSSSSVTSTPAKTHIRGKACNFPRLRPFDPSITEFIKSPPTIDCTKDYSLVFRTNFRNKLILWSNPFSSNQTRGLDAVGIGNFSCCYKTLTRGNGSDHNIIYSKRCYPIVKVETEIPTEHEFISLRCRTGIRKESEGPLEKNKANENDGHNGNNYNNNKISANNDNTTNTATSRKTESTTKFYKDMLAFVPLKPMVEARIRQYEEKKRKYLYTHKEATKENNSGTRVSESGSRGPKQGINLSTGRRHDSVNKMKSSENSDDRLSLLILGLDAQSHMNFIRQMPLTYNFLTRNLSSIGLYGYTKVGDNTFPNVVSLLSGLNVEELEKVCWPTKQSYFDSCPFIWRKFGESGYRTSLAEDSVWMGIFNYEKKGFLHQPTDYYLHPMSLLMARKIGHETWANAKLCYGPRLAFEVLLDYIVKTAVTFRNSLYFQFVWANSLFHDYLNNPRLGDELLSMTLQFLSSNGFLQNTAFILLSDHGIRWGNIRSTYQGKIEERMPVAYFTFPLWFQRKYPGAMRNLRKNMLRLTTPFDVHETLKDILHLGQGRQLQFDRWSDGGPHGKEKSKGFSALPPRGISLFRPIPLRRTCEMAGIEEHWCVCHKMEQVPINSTLVESGARFVLDIINGLLKTHGELCAQLDLLKITESKRKIDGNIDRGLDVDFFKMNPTTPSSMIVPNTIPNHEHDEKSPSESKKSKEEDDVIGKLSTSSDIKKMIQLQITLITIPGEAVFEATIYREAKILSNNRESMEDKPRGVINHHGWKLSGDISRLNLYGAQSACIADYKVQKYCYCRNAMTIQT